MIRHIPLIFKNAIRNRRRTLLTVASIAASFALLGTLAAMYRALFWSDPVPGQELRLMTRHRVSLTQSMPASYEQKIRAVPGVQAVSIVNWFGGTYKDEQRDRSNMFARFSTDPANFFEVRPDVKIAEDQKQAFLRNRRGAIAGKTLAAKKGWRIGERINLTGDIWPVNLELELVGTYEEATDDESLYFHHEYIRESFPQRSARRDLVGLFWIRVDSADSVPRVSKAIDTMFENSPAQTRTESELAFGLAFAAFLGNIKLFLAAICGAIVFTILLVTANTVAMSVRERKREVGILKTLGYTPSAVLSIILGEAAVISVLGGALGLFLAMVLAAGIRQGPAVFQQLKQVYITPTVALAGIAAALLIGVASSFTPAWNASRTPILTALRATD
ncbi:MAG: ABC transporter permease [Bryobacteraceae bacterium]|nr:ABC transporter permease [Bryobacteraceae bacterium]